MYTSSNSAGQILISSNKLTIEIEAPVLYALPVRPIRCTYPPALRGISKLITYKCMNIHAVKGHTHPPLGRENGIPLDHSVQEGTKGDLRNIRFCFPICHCTRM